MMIITLGKFQTRTEEVTCVIYPTPQKDYFPSSASRAVERMPPLSYEKCRTPTAMLLDSAADETTMEAVTCKSLNS